MISFTLHNQLERKLGRAHTPISPGTYTIMSSRDFEPKKKKKIILECMGIGYFIRLLHSEISKTEEADQIIVSTTSYIKKKMSALKFKLYTQTASEHQTSD